MVKSVYSRIKASSLAQWFFKYSGLGSLRIFVRWFGWESALKLLWAKSISQREPVQIKHPRFKAPVFLRAGTSDPFIYAEVLHQQIYATALPSSARLIVDAGANIGLSSVFFANRFPNAQIIAIEPSETNMALLRCNVASYPKVHPKLAGLWPSTGPLRLVNPNAEAWAIQVEPCQLNEADFQGITVPEILKEYQVPQIDLIKIDIEGAEWPLLFDSVPDWLNTVNFVAMELHEQPGRGSFDQVVQLMNTYGLRLVSVDGGNHVFARQ